MCVSTHWHKYTGTGDGPQGWADVLLTQQHWHQKKRELGRQEGIPHMPQEQMRERERATNKGELIRMK